MVCFIRVFDQTLAEQLYRDKAIYNEDAIGFSVMFYYVLGRQWDDSDICKSGFSPFAVMSVVIY